MAAFRSRPTAVSCTALVVVIAVAAWNLSGRASGANSDWPAYAGDKASTKYSPLDQIDRVNIKALTIAWRRSGLPEELRTLYPDAQAPANYQHTPLVVNGLLYMSTAVGVVMALEPTTGKTVWHDTLPPRPDGQPSRGGATRSLAYWSDGKDARILANIGSSLVALNAKTGKRYADFGENGQVDLLKGFDRPITGWRWSSGPLVVKDVIIIAGVPAPATDILNERVRAPKEMPPDDIRGYDVRTGKHLWTFNVVPRKGEFGNETWLNDSWTYSGNSGTWSLISGDEELGHVYLPTENATGDYYGGTRPGTNLFSESVLALDAKTGKRVWHFQVVHHGLWDYDLPAAPLLADITVNGRRIKALAQVSKQAFVYVLDRTNGKPVWPIEERPVPQGQRARRMVFAHAAVPEQAAGLRSAGRVGQGPHRLHAGAEGRGAEDRQRVQVRPALHAAGGARQPRRPEGHDLHARHQRRRRLGRRGVRQGDQRPLRAVGAPARHPRARQVAALESTLPFVKQAVPRLTGPRGLPDPFKPPYSRLVAIDLNKGDILWSVANGDGLKNHPAFAGIANLPAMGKPGRLAALVTKNFVFMGEGSDSGVGLGGLARPRRRADVPRLRQEDRRHRVGDGAAGRRQQRADDLHGRRPPVHRRGRVRPPVSRRAHRAGAASLARSVGQVGRVSQVGQAFCPPGPAFVGAGL